MKINYEYVFLAAFSLAFLLVGFSAFENKLSHPFPTGYFASDAFFHASESEWMKDSGKVLYAQPSMVGKHVDVYDAHPPFVFEETSLFSYGSGLKVYDAIYVLTIVTLLLLALIVYVIIRPFSRGVAMLSVPFTLLVFSQPFNQVVNFGQWLFIPGAMFMVAVFWAMPRLSFRHWYVPLGFLFAGLAIAHQPEIFIAAGFVILYFGMTVLSERKLRLNEVKNTLLAAVVALPLAAFSLYLFSLGLFQVEEIVKPLKKDFLFFTFDTAVAEKGFADISLFSSFGVFFFLILLGIGLFLFMKKENIWPGAIGLYMLALGYATLLGLGKRAFAHRWLWHFYLAFFVGLALYHVIRMLSSSAKLRIDVRHTATLSLVLLVILAQPVFGKVKGTIMDQYNWDALMWLRESTPEDINVHYFFVNYLEQTPTIYNSRRMAFLVDYRKYFQESAFPTVKRQYEFGSTYAYGTFLCSIQPFNAGYYHQLLKSDSDPCTTEGGVGFSVPSQEVDLCSIEYYYFNKAGYAEQPVRHNLMIMQELLKNPWIREVYSNPLVSILKNERPGDDCLGQNSTG